jgi:NACHT domain-containing protein/NACHT conflict system protein
MARPAFFRIAVVTLKTAIILLNPSMKDRFDAVQDWASQILPSDSDSDVSVRDLQRQIDSAIDKVADYLETIQVSEYGNIAENEISAGLAEVSEVVHESFRLFRADELIGNALTPSDVAAILRTKLEARFATQPISEGAKNFSRTVLEAASYQLVNWVHDVPEIQNRVAWQTLTNTWNLTTSTTEILKELRQTGLVGARDAGRVVNSQRRDIAAVLGKMELFGMPAESRFRRVPFAESYVTPRATPTAKATAQTISFDDLILGILKHDTDKNSHGMRLLLNGRAGSGKTTAAQWLVYQSATGKFDDRNRLLAQTIPFFVRLRAILDRESAIPPDSSLLMSGQLREGLGPDWLESLAPYQPLIVLDGWDEIGASVRSLADSWLASICLRFPQSHIIVTTRPEGSTDPVFREHNFLLADMALLREQDKLDIIRRWFLGVRANLTQTLDLDEPYLIDSYNQLVRDIRTPSLSKLAETPLLVAMLCCLYASSTRRSPMSKGALYETVASVLIHHRDRDRQVRSGLWDELQSTQKEDFLGSAALIMSENNSLHLPVGRGGSATSLEDVARQALPSFGMSPSLAGVLATAAVQRSVVLQRVGTDDGEFVHRSFQDYFAGFVLARRRDTERLFELARDDVYIGTLPFAVRGSDQKTAEEIVAWVTFEIDNCSDARFRGLAFTLVECLNATPALDPRLRREAVRAVAPLFPPENSDEAAALATLGDAAVDFLRVTDSPHLDRYCIEALSRIGTEHAVGALAKYAEVRGRDVIEYLMEAWERLPEKEYAEKVLTKIAPYVSLKIRTTEQMESAPSIRTAQSLVIEGIDFRRTSLTSVSGLSHLRSLSLKNCRGFGDCLPLRRLTDLETLHLVGMDDLATLQGLADLRIRHLSLRDLTVNQPDLPVAIGSLISLRVLWIEHVRDGEGNSAILGEAGLRSLRSLRSLVLDLGEDKADVGFLENMKLLSVFGHSGWLDNNDLRHVGGLPMLRAAGLRFSLSSVGDTDFSGLASLAQLQRLAVSRARLGERSRLNQLRHLTTLRCSDSFVGAVDSAAFPNSLRSLELRNCTGLQSSAQRHQLPAVESLIWHGPELNDLEFLQSFPSLRYLEIVDASNITDVSGVRYLPPGCRGVITGVASSVQDHAIRDLQDRCTIRYEPRVSSKPTHSVDDYPVLDPGQQTVS